MSTQALNQERSIAQLFGDLATETGTLFRQEVKLATTEIAQKAAHAGKQVAYVAAGALLGLLALQAMLASAVVVLAWIMPLWASALAVGGALALIAVVFISKGASALHHMNPTPQQTILSLEDTKSWMKKAVQ